MISYIIEIAKESKTNYTQRKVKSQKQCRGIGKTTKRPPNRHHSNLAMKIYSYQDRYAKHADNPHNAFRVVINSIFN